jgi:hypothetical protein
MPVDVMDDLQEISQAKEMSSVEALIQFYVGQGLRRDLPICGESTLSNRPNTF